MGHSNGGAHNRGKGEAIKWLRDHVNYEHDYCLIWPFSCIRGYGNFGYLGKVQYAHRFMCELAHGPAPSLEHHAAHSCGRGNCVNPRHISWKTPSENQLDKREHGTMYAEGCKHKLSPRDVIAIRSMRDQKTQDDLAKMFGVSRRNIGAILDGRSWTKLLPPDGQ